ncbi:GGDEF domain-containing protein [Amorphus sp. MBR-141]
MTKDAARLGLYLWMSRLPWPKSYFVKVLAVCFLGTHVPLIITAVALFFGLRVPHSALLPVLAVLLGSTLAATVLTLVLVRRLLAPIRAVGDALDAYRRFGIIQDLPGSGGDEAGAMMRSVNETLHAVDDLRANLENLSFEDPLTGLGNRRWLLSRAKDMFSRRSGDESVALAVIDVDRLKALNDGYGHSFGDAALRAVSEILRRRRRAADLVARIGGDEFCVMFLGLTTDTAAEWLDDVRTGLADVMGPDSVPLSFSAGVTNRRSDGEDYEEMFARADRALYLAKSAGRSSTRILQAADAPAG